MIARLDRSNWPYKQRNVRLHLERFKKLKKLAVEQDVSPADIIDELIRRFLADTLSTP